MDKTIPATPWEMEHHPHRGAEAHGYISVNDANGNAIFDTANASYKLAMQMDEGEGEQKWYERGLEPAMQLATAAPLLRDALKAVLVMWDRGPCPQKLDEALSWRENDERARKMAESALAAAGEAKAQESEADKQVKSLRNALGDLICGGCGHRIGWNGEHDAEQTRLCRTDWKKCKWCAEARRALRGEKVL